MKFIIRHEIKGRLRIHAVQGRMTCAQADTLCWFLEKQEYITDAKVYERTAASIAKRVGVDEYYSEVLPDEKARFVEREKSSGRRVIMIGDGINDSPALSAADAGIAVSDGAELAREIADITIASDDLGSLVTLKALANTMMKRIRRNYRGIVGINSGLIALGVGGVIQPAVSALLHNTSTLAISLGSMRKLLEEE